MINIHIIILKEFEILIEFGLIKVRDNEQPNSEYWDN